MKTSRQTACLVALLLPVMSYSALSRAEQQWVPARTATPPTAPAVPATPTPGATATTSAPTAVTGAVPKDTPPPAPLNANTPLPPPPPSNALSYARDQSSALSREEIEAVAGTVDKARRGRAYQPVATVPRTSTLTVSLSPGASQPVLRTALKQSSTVTFSDSTGAPWVIAAPPYNANATGFYVTYIPDSPVMTVQALREYDTGNVQVYLKGLRTPVTINLSSGESDFDGKAQVVDSRLDLRIPGRGPSAAPSVTGVAKIDLNDTVLQQFLDGVPPSGAQRIKSTGAVPDTAVWQIGDDLYVRSREELRDEFEKTSSSGDGTHVYKLPVTPTLSFSVMGNTVPLTLNLE